MKKTLPIILIALAVLFDIGSKMLVVEIFSPYEPTEEAVEEIEVIGDYFRIKFVENPGMAFGILSGIEEPYNHLIFTTLTLLAVIFVVVYFRNVISERLVIKGAFAFILGGAIANLLDRIFGNILYRGEWRLFFGKVIDFLDFGYGEGPYERWPTFNLADAFITVGVVVLIFYIIFRKREKIFEK